MTVKEIKLALIKEIANNFDDILYNRFLLSQPYDESGERLFVDMFIVDVQETEIYKQLAAGTNCISCSQVVDLDGQFYYLTRINGEMSYSLMKSSSFKNMNDLFELVIDDLYDMQHKDRSRSIEIDLTDEDLDVIRNEGEHNWTFPIISNDKQEVNVRLYHSPEEDE